MRRPLASMLLAFATAPAVPGRAAEPPPALFEAVEVAADLCRVLGGSPAILPGYQTVLDLNGDGRDDFLTDQAQLQCAGASGSICGAAGCAVTAWLSEPGGGHAPFDLGELQGVEVREAPGELPAVRAHYAGSACGAGPGGSEGCTRTWVFASNAPAFPEPDPPATPAVAEEAPEEPPAPPAAPEEAPAAAAEAPEPVLEPPAAQAAAEEAPEAVLEPLEPPAAAEEPPEPAREPPEPLPPGWTLREAPDGSLVALAGGIGRIASLAAFCLSDQPFLVVTLIENPDSGSLALSFAFGSGEAEVEAGYEAAAGGTYVVALAGHPLAALLAGRDSEVAVRTDDREEGVLSLSGSTRALRSALEGCYSF